MNYDFGTTPAKNRPLPLTLNEIESAHLVRRIADNQPSTSLSAYIFKHALIQDEAYMSLTRNERKRLHRLVARVLERLNAAELDENAALLAYHFERADEPRQTFAYLQRAADWARRGAAYREQAALLKRAIEIAETADETELLSRLRAQRGQALLNVTEWREALSELTRALEEAPVHDIRLRAQILLDLAATSQWLWDIARSLEYAQVALQLAEQLGDNMLAASAMTQLAVAQTSDGRPQESIESFTRAFQRAGSPSTLALVRALEYFGLGLYWMGEQESSIARSEMAIERARALTDHVTIVRALSNLGAAQAARGNYGAALAIYQEACEHAAQNNILPWLARALSMRSGLHLDLFDYAGAEEYIDQARITARRAQFSATLVGSAIDLIFSSVQRGELVRADRFVRQVEETIHTIYGSHRWLWEVRFLQARAELALARGDLDAALKWADEALARSHSTGRRKYQLLARLTRAQARGEREYKAALQDTRAALALAQELGDPLLLLRAAAIHLRFEKEESVRAAARAARAHIADSLPESSLRDRFLAVVCEWL